MPPDTSTSWGIPAAVAILLGVITAQGLGAQPASFDEHERGADHVTWSRSPITVRLSVNRQRRITFPVSVLFGQTAELASTLEVQSVADTLYLTARAPFEDVQVLVRECTTRGGTCHPDGAIYLLSLSADKNPGQQPPLFVHRPQSDGSDLHDDGSGSKQRVPDPVILVRYAAQQLFAPERLLSGHADIHRTPVPRDTTTTLYQGGAFLAAPLAGWTDGVHYVTAVQFANRTEYPQPLDVRAIRGRWLSRTMLAGHSLVPPRHARRPRTTVLLVSAAPFKELVLWLR